MHPHTHRPQRFLPLLGLLGASCLHPPYRSPGGGAWVDSGGPRLGAGEHTYTWVRDFGTLPGGEPLGNTHGAIAIDSEGRVYVNTDTERAVVVFDRDGRYLRSFGAELAGGLHAMIVVEEQGRGEVLYLVHTGRHEVLKTTLEGEILWRRGYPAEALAAGEPVDHEHVHGQHHHDPLYADEGGYRPTAVAVAPNGDVYVADGYGLSYVHQFRPDGDYVRSFGGPGAEDGRFHTCHGIALDFEDGEPVLWVADRENGRLQVFDLQGRHRRTVQGDLRRPCSMTSRGGDRVVADLAGRVTILDREGELLLHLGEQPDPAKWANNGVPPEEWREGEFIAPHYALWDEQGNLYVMDWVSAGRITKLARVR
jgi:DNA-binding beta-propeller fold protein YncE